ncbi:hypothetical protein E5Q_02881 [Mixia osmundae IAM 14324]|uniref:Elongator complex protein 4 n=1 Tax=Mixia osmundae (strain CBS 9802 / IAM 14324 / JCM 22182 / KY 12970) TaxID=764103 RepID=G7E057_MIXOS|nr:hypothetical protein E5Q_02881 [Mixia osmundae IAM 14324]
MSFKRRTPSAPGQVAQSALTGTKLSAYNSATLASTGVAALDDILGGGQPLGTVLLLEEDHASSYAKLLLKFYLSQGLSCKDHRLLLVSSSLGEGDAPDAIFASLMAAEDTSITSSETVTAPQLDMKIAFRYAGLKRFESGVPDSVPTSSTDAYCSAFDLTRTRSVIQAEQQRMSHIDAASHSLEDVLSSVKEASLAAQQGQYVLRVVLQSFIGPQWNDVSATLIMRFLMELRSIVRKSPVVVVISSPTHLIDDKALTQRVRHCCDGVLGLESFIGRPDLAAAFPRYSGLLHVTTLPAVNSLVPSSTKLSVLRGLAAGSAASSGAGGLDNNLAFRLKRKRFVIETLHLDVEGGVGERQIPKAEAQPVGGGEKLKVDAEARPVASALRSKDAKRSIPRAGVRFRATEETETPPVVEAAHLHEDW